MSYLMQPYLNQRTMVLRSALVDNTATSWSVTGDGTTNTFEQAGKSKWWGNSEKFHDFEGSGTLHGKSMIKRFRLNEDKDTESNGTIFINFDIRDVNPYFMGQKNYTLKLVINDNYEVNLRTDQDRPDSGLTDGGIRWEKDDGAMSYNVSPTNIWQVWEQATVNYRIAVPYDVAYDTKHKDNYQNELIKVELKATEEDGSDHSFMLDNFVITEQEKNTITDEILTHNFDVGAYDNERRQGWVGYQKDGINLSSIKKLRYGESNETNMLVGANDTVVTQTFTRDTNLDGIRIDFDMFELDSWDNEKFYITINDQEIELGKFYYKTTEEGGFDRNSDWIQWQRTDTPDMYDVLNSSTSWKDQKHIYSIFVHNEFFEKYNKPTDEVEIKFSSDLSTPLSHNTESWAIDNFQIRNHKDDNYFFDSEGVEVITIDIKGNIDSMKSNDEVKQLTDLDSKSFEQVAALVSDELATLQSQLKDVRNAGSKKGFMKLVQETIGITSNEPENLAISSTEWMDLVTDRYEHYAKVLWKKAFEYEEPGEFNFLIINLIASIVSVVAAGVTSVISAGTTIPMALVSIGAAATNLAAATNAMLEQREDVSDVDYKTYTGQIDALESAAGVFGNLIEAHSKAENDLNVIDDSPHFDILAVSVENNINRLSDMVANIQLVTAFMDWQKTGSAGKSGLSFGDTDAISNSPATSHNQTPGLGFDVEAQLLETRKVWVNTEGYTVVPGEDRVQTWEIKISSDERKLMFPGDSDQFGESTLHYEFERFLDYDTELPDRELLDQRDSHFKLLTEPDFA
jgi:hypothetical protein